MKAIKLVDLVEVLSSVSEGNIRNKAFSSELFEGFGIIEFSIKDMYFIFFTKKMNPILRDIASDNVFCQKILSIQKEARTMVINHGSGLLFQLQQLGLHFGFRSHIIWWQDYLINNYHQLYEKKNVRRTNCYEKTSIR